MIKHKLKNAPWFFFLFLLFGCEKEIPFPDQDATPVLVINSAFTADSSMTIHVSKTAPLTLAAPSIVPDAAVFIIDEFGLSTTFNHLANGQYKAMDFSPQSGVAYTVEASANGLAEVTATNVIPGGFGFTLVDTTYGFQENIPAWIFDVEIQDNGQEASFYILDVTYQYEDPAIVPIPSESSGFLDFAHFSFDLASDNGDLLSDSEYNDSGLRGIYLSSANFENGRHQTSFAVADRNLSKEKEGKTIITLRVRSVNNDLFEYYKSLERYRLNQGNFFADPIQIFSNIENGVGIFAGFNEKLEVLELVN